MVTYNPPVPNIVAALVSIFKSALANDPKILVKDGMWVSEEAENFYAVVGWSGFTPGYQYPSRSMSEDLFGANITVVATREGLAPSLREKIDVNCAVIGRTADTTGVAEARTAVYGYVKQCGQAVANNRTLNGSAMLALMGMTSSLHQVQDRRGSLAIVTFDVQCQAYSQQ